MTCNVGKIERVVRGIVAHQQLFDQQLLGYLREVHAPWLRVVRGGAEVPVLIIRPTSRGTKRVLLQKGVQAHVGASS